MQIEKNWYAVYIRQGHEKKTLKQLAKKGIEYFYPEVKSVKTDRRKSPALFPSYIFVYIHNEDRVKVTALDTILSFVHWKNEPANICGEEISVMKQFLNEYENIRVEKTEVRPSEPIKILNGPLMMWEGNILEIKTNEVKINLPSLGYSLVASINIPQPRFESEYFALSSTKASVG